jgi:PEP-CTERM motif
MRSVIGSMTGVALAGFLAIAGGLATPNAARAALVDLTYDLTLDGMSTGTCAGSVCATSLATITVVGDTTTSIRVTVDLTSGVSFHANHSGSSGTGNFFFDDITDTGGTLSFSAIGTNGTGYSYGTPTSGSFAETGNFPGPYNTESPCTNSTAGKICGSPYTFTVNANGGTLAFLSPAGAGDFPTYDIPFVADLSIAAGTAGLCTGDAACTGLVGAALSSTPVPEPSTWAMMLLGFAGLGYAGYRKTKNARTALSVA